MHYDELPLFLRVTELATVMQVGKNKAYELVNRKDFPKIRVGHRILIPRDLLIEWIESQTSHPYNS